MMNIPVKCLKFLKDACLPFFYRYAMVLPMMLMQILANNKMKNLINTSHHFKTNALVFNVGVRPSRHTL